MFNVSFWTFKKAIDSTKRPAGTPAASFSNCDIVQPFTVEDPEIIVSDNRAAGWNYLYIVEFERYYFVTGRTFIDGLWFLKCHVDVLATFKPEIGAEELYFLRSSAAYNTYIRDNYYPMTGEASRSSVLIPTTDIETNFNSGRYVINVVGKQSGTSTLYQMTPAAFSTFLDSLLGVIDNTTVTLGDYWEALKNSMFNPIQYITSVMWFPFAFSASGSGSLKVGLWDSGVSADIITTPTKRLTYRAVLHKHPQAYRGKYLNAAPFTKYVLTFEPFGVIDLDPASLIDVEAVTLQILVDAMTGQGSLKVYAQTSDGEPVASVNSQFGVPLRLAQGDSGMGSISGLLQTVGGVVAGAVTGNTALIAGAVSAGIGDFSDSLRGMVSTIGSSGGITSHVDVKSLDAIHYLISGTDDSKNGRPYMRQNTAAALGGFLLAQRGDVPINGTSQEAAEIKAKLERGFYYE